MTKTLAQIIDEMENDVLTPETFDADRANDLLQVTAWLRWGNMISAYERLVELHEFNYAVDVKTWIENNA